MERGARHEKREGYKYLKADQSPQKPRGIRLYEVGTLREYISKLLPRNFCDQGKIMNIDGYAFLVGGGITVPVHVFQLMFSVDPLVRGCFNKILLTSEPFDS